MNAHSMLGSVGHKLRMGMAPKARTSGLGGGLIFGVGAIAGAGIAYLLTSPKGEELRAQAQEMIGQLRAQFTEVVNQVVHSQGKAEASSSNDGTGKVSRREQSRNAATSIGDDELEDLTAPEQQQS